MTIEQSQKLAQARSLIFEVEQEWRKEFVDNSLQKDMSNKANAAKSLYKCRIELDNAMSRG